MDSSVDCASKGRLYLQVIDVGRRMMVGSEVIYHIALRKEEPMSLSETDCGLFYLGPGMRMGLIGE